MIALEHFRVILHSNMRSIHQNFTVDLRNFNNFQVPPSDNLEQLSEYGIQVLQYQSSFQCFVVIRLLSFVIFQVVEQNIAENAKIKEISELFAKFLETAPGLENFSPGLFVTDRSQNDMEPHTFSLCFK